MELIADDYPAIAARMAQIAHGRQVTQFTLPDNIEIVDCTTNEVLWMNPRMKELATYDMCFVLTKMSLDMIKTRSGTFMSSAGLDMLDHITRFFPSAIVFGTKQIMLSIDDTLKMAAMIKRFSLV